MAQPETCTSFAICSQIELSHSTKGIGKVGKLVYSTISSKLAFGSFLMHSLWLTSWPHCGSEHESEREFTNLQKQLQIDGLGRIFPFEMPVLSVGTLDTLMGLSDEVVKLNIQVEAVLKKVERQYYDISSADCETLRVDEVTVPHFLKDFHWDIARFRHASVPIMDLVSQIQSTVGGIDEESKRMAVSLTEANQALGLAQRKKVINLASSPLEDIFTPQMYKDASLVEGSDVFTPVLVVVGANQREDFLRDYMTLGDDIACFGGPEWDYDNSSLGKPDGNYGPYSSRGRIKGSPVIPHEPVLVTTVGEVSMYAIVILKGHTEAGIIMEDGTMSEGQFVDYVEPFVAACKAQKVTVRKLEVDLHAVENFGADGAVEQAMSTLHDVQYKARHWCLSHFGELYSSWIHLKVIRGFVESVLRYGLHAGKSARYQACFVEPTIGQEKALEEALGGVIGKLRPEIVDVNDGMAADDEEEETSESLFFVCHPFSVLGTSRA